MTEQPISGEEALLNTYYQSGKLTTLTGIKPDEAIQQLVKEDPKKQAAFLDGAVAGQILKAEEENLTSK